MMKQSVMRWFVAGVVVGGLIRWGSPEASGADDKKKSQAASLACGYVDIDQVLEKYDQFKQDNETFRGFVREREDTLKLRAANRMLTEEEWKEFTQLSTKKDLSAKEQPRLDELKELSGKREEELQKLQVTKDLTDDQKKRLGELQDLIKGNLTRIEELQKSLTGEVQQKDAEMSKKIQAAIQTAIADVANQKGVTLVLDKKSVLFGGTDLTDQVAEKLNKGK